MDSPQFDSLTRIVSTALTRRRVGWLAGLGALAAGTTSLLDPTGAKAKRRGKRRKRQVKNEHNIRGKKAIMCFEGKTVRVPRNKRKQWLRKGATRGKCTANPVCTPVCPDGSCLIDDGCGGTCPDCGKGFICTGGVCEVCKPVCPKGSCNIDDGCGGECPGCGEGEVCAEGMCEACNVFCDGEPAACGIALNEMLVDGGNIYLCPGIYEGPFLTPANANLYGSGSGNDGTVDTILRGKGSIPSYNTFRIEEGVTLLFSRVRITDGRDPDGLYGGDVHINHPSANVTVNNCVITNGEAEQGGAFYIESGTLAISNCHIVDNEVKYYGAGVAAIGTSNVSISDTLFSGNTSDADGGAIYIWQADSTMTVTGCTITKNTAAEKGGGIAAEGGYLTVTDTTITDNTAGILGGGMYCESGTVDLDPTVSITLNKAQVPGPSGGGVFNYVDAPSVFNRNLATISGNTPDQCVGPGC